MTIRITEITSAPELIHAGRRVRFVGGAGIDGGDGVIVRVSGEPNTAPREVLGGFVSVISNADCNVDIILFDGSQHLGVSQCSLERSVGIGFRLLDRVHGPGMIEALKQRAAAREAASVIKRAEDANAFDRACRDLITANQHLQPIANVSRRGVAAVAKNVRAALKHAGIPWVSVRSDSYSGGNSISVTLPATTTDEKRELATEIADRFRLGHFDGMNDIYEFSRSPWTEVFGGTWYIDVTLVRAEGSA